MYDPHTVGVARIHFAVQCCGIQMLYWCSLLFWTLFGGMGITRGTATEISLLLLAASLLEMALRRPFTRVLCGLSKQERWAVSQRQMLFLLGAAAGDLFLGHGREVPPAFLIIYLSVAAGWVGWSNLVGFRMLHRALYRRSTKRTRMAAAGSGEQAMARAA